MSRLHELRIQRKRLITWMDMCDAHFSVNANEKLHKIEQEIKEYEEIN